MKRHHWLTFTARLHFPWPVCSGCGLVRIHNERTDAAVRRPCPGGE